MKSTIAKTFSLLCFICCLIYFFPFFSCIGKRESSNPIRLGGTYRIPYHDEITCLDPAACGEGSIWVIGSQVYEGLLTYSKNESKIIPLLAEKFSVNGLSITFHLKKGVRFHDDPCFPGGMGRELSAADIKYTFERRYNYDGKIQKSLGSGVKIFGYEDFITGKSSQIEGLKVLGKYLFEIKLTKPDPDLLSSLTGYNLFIVPKEAVDYYGEDFKLHPVGTGPFRFSEFTPNVKLILVKNEKYWGVENNIRLPYLDAIEYILYSPGENEKMLLDFQTGKIEECTQEAADYLRELVELNGQNDIELKGWLKEQEIQFIKNKNFRKLRYLEVVEGNKKVRQAMSYAINRERLVKNQTDIFHNYIVAKGPLPPNSVYYDEKLQGQFYDPIKARQLLAEAGYPGGKGLPKYPFISLPSPDVDLIINDLQAVGFKIKKLDPFPGWRELIVRREPSLVRMINVNTSPQAYNVLYPFFDTTGLQADTHLIRVYNEWQKDEQTITNTNLINRLEEIIVEITPKICLYHIDGEFRLLQRNVRSRQIGNGWGHKLLNVWLDNKNVDSNSRIINY